MKTFQILSRALGALRRCETSGNTGWAPKWRTRIAELLGEFPSGSGFDSGTKLDESSTPEKLVFDTAFHHMNDGGFYDGWSEHSVIVTPSLEFGISIRVTGRDRDGIKEYVAECFEIVLNSDREEYPKPQTV